MSRSKTRKRQLDRLASRRMADRRRRRQRRIALITAAGLIGLFGAGSGLTFLLGAGDEESPEPTPSPTGTPEPGGVACGGEVPPQAGESKPTFEERPRMRLDPRTRYRAVVRTSCGRIELDLFARQAPTTVNSFVFLARQGFFDGLIFHRVVPGFVIQGGDPQGTGTGGPGYQFENETDPELRFDQPGVLAMANSGPDTNGSQFFITVAEAPGLNDGYTIFGQVTEGMDVVERINALPTDADERPLQTVYVERVRIIEG